MCGHYKYITYFKCCMVYFACYYYSEYQTHCPVCSVL